MFSEKRAHHVTQVILPNSTPADDSDNPTKTNTYDKVGRLLSVTDPFGNTTSFEYDALGRKTKVIDAVGNQSELIYDSLGRKTQSIDAQDRITKFEYDVLGNLVKTIYPDNTANDDSDNLTSLATYNELNQQVTTTDLAGNLTRNEYSGFQNLTAVIDSLNQRTEYAYDQRGNKTSQKDANGNITTWTYDELGRLSSKTLPEGQSEIFNYNAVGNILSKTDFNGDITSYEYNDLNQQTKITYADGSTVSMSYNVTGKIATITQPQGITSYQYDKRDRLSRIDYPTGSFIAYLFDINGNRIQLQTASQTVDYSFDSLNRMATVTDTNGITSYTYDLVGNLATQTNTNGTKATYSYDPLNRLTSLIHTNSSNNIIASYQYTLGANGNRQSITEATGRIVDYTYDSLYRLITETINDPINGNHQSEFTYDPVGNRLQQIKDGITTTYVYNNNDQILSEIENAQITSYSYDNNGNTLTKSIDGTLNTSYSYNKDNYMTQVITPTSTIINTYDLAGIRQSQSVEGVITNYLVDPNRAYAQVLEEQNGINNPQVTYVYGHDLITQTNNQGTHTFAYDGLGSTRVLTDATGTVQNSYGYQAFGEIDYQLGTVENKYLFTGEQYDNNIGFYYLRARFYNPGIGRFQNMDTFAGLQFEPTSLHKYLYANGNPANIIDPSGNIGIGSFTVALRVSRILATYATVLILADFSGHAIVNGQSHRYEFKNKICRIGNFGCTKKNVFFALRHFPAPVTKVQLAGPSTISLLWGIPGQKNEVSHEVDQTSFIVINKTKPTHVFHDGIVERKVVSQGGYLQIHSIGSGKNSNSLYAYLNARMAPGVFAWPDARIKGYIESGEIKPENSFGFFENFCYVGFFCN